MKQSNILYDGVDTYMYRNNSLCYLRLMAHIMFR